MNRFFTGLAVGILGTVLIGGFAFYLMPVQAHGLTKAEQAIFDHTKLQCREDAKAKGLGLFERRKYIASCVMDSLKGHPEMDPFDFD